MRADESGCQLNTRKVRDVRERSLRSRVMRNSIVMKNWEIYSEYNFNSVALQCDLLKNKIYTCGTARKDIEGILNELKTNKKNEKG